MRGFSWRAASRNWSRADVASFHPSGMAGPDHGWTREPELFEKYAAKSVEYLNDALIGGASAGADDHHDQRAEHARVQ